MRERRTHLQEFSAKAAALLTCMVCVLCAACGNEAAATAMKLARAEGEVSVRDEKEKDLTLAEDMNLYSGYQLKTGKESYSYINLDSVKLTKMDEESDIEIQKSGKDLEILLNSGSLFFNVTKPLEKDETMNIRTSTMAVGIRGTCGWVAVPGEGEMYVYILEGTVECSITDPDTGEVAAAQTVTEGESARLTWKDGKAEIIVEKFTKEEIPFFVTAELEKDSRFEEQVGEILAANEEASGNEAEGGEGVSGEEGEGADHKWVDATCSAPKTCSECGETEGEALGHNWVEATYQSPATCIVCNISDGEMLQGDFDKHGIICNVELDKEYPYTTLTYRNKDISINGTVLFSNYRTFESDEEREGIEGYEWKSIDVTFSYDDDNAWDYGTTSAPFTTDFYNIEPKSQSGPNKSENDVGILDNNDTYTVNFNGIDYTECLKEDHALVMEWNNRVYTCKIQFSFRVPIGYDGSIVGAISDGKYNDGDYIYEVADENTLFFRLK